MFILEESNESAWREAEQFWIASLRLAGADLCNLTDGGQGPSGYKLSEEHKRKIGSARRGHKHSEEAIRRMSLAKIGKSRPDLSARNILSAKIGVEIVEDIRTRLRNGEVGRSVATLYGVSPALVCLIGQGKRRTITAHVQSGEVK
jgi:hypothetical protein